MNRIKAISVIIALLCAAQPSLNATLSQQTTVKPTGCFCAMKRTVQNAIANYQQNRLNKQLYRLSATLVKVTEIDRKDPKAHELKLNELIEHIELLIKQGAQVNSQHGKLKRTPLMNAALNGSNWVMQALIKLEADINQQDAEGNTALILITRGPFHPLICDMMTLLIAGASFSIRNNVGQTAYIPFIGEALQYIQKRKENAEALENLQRSTQQLLAFTASLRQEPPAEVCVLKVPAILAEHLGLYPILECKEDCEEETSETTSQIIRIAI